MRFVRIYGKVTKYFERGQIYYTKLIVYSVEI